MAMKLFVLFLLLVVRVGQAASGSGLYIMLRNETTRMVAVRQITYIEAATKTELTSWSVALGQCPVNLEIVSYSAMDTVRHIFVGKLVFNLSAKTSSM